jgi:hypothetical protein
MLVRGIAENKAIAQAEEIARQSYVDQLTKDQ